MTIGLLTLFSVVSDDTQDPMEDEQQLTRVKDWINSRHLDTVELTDVLSNFPDISVVRILTCIECGILIVLLACRLLLETCAVF